MNHQPSERSEGNMEIQARPEITGARADAIVIGLLAGMLSALLGVGGGLLMVPAMLYLLRIGPHRAHGTSLAVMVPTAIAALSQYAGDLQGKWGIALWLALGGVLGATIGARLAAAMKSPALKPVLGVLVVIVGIGMIAAPGAAGTLRGAGFPSVLPPGPISVLVGV